VLLSWCAGCCPASSWLRELFAVSWLCMIVVPSGAAPLVTGLFLSKLEVLIAAGHVACTDVAAAVCACGPGWCLKL
jgi:hypothetical protein